MTNHDTSTDAFKRARDLKASIMQNVSILQSATNSLNLHAATSLEDTAILALRGEGKSWGDIATHLNERREANSEAPTWNEAAVYARFVLSSSGAASPTREVGFEPCDYVHLKNAGSGREGTSKAGKKRVKDFQNATELSANIRTPATVVGIRGKEEGENVAVQVKDKGKGNAKAKGKDEDRRKGGSEEEIVTMDEGMTELLMRAVAKVERNFWVFVADEVEREAGKFIEPKDLEKVFHEI